MINITGCGFGALLKSNYIKYLKFHIIYKLYGVPPNNLPRTTV